MALNCSASGVSYSTVSIVTLQESCLIIPGISLAIRRRIRILLQNSKTGKTEKEAMASPGRGLCKPVDKHTNGRTRKIQRPAPRGPLIHGFHAATDFAKDIDEIFAEAGGEENFQTVERAVDAHVLDTGRRFPPHRYGWRCSWHIRQGCPIM